MSPQLNSLLADLPSHEYDALTAGIQLVSLEKGDTLFNIGQTPQHLLCDGESRSVAPKLQIILRIESPDHEFSDTHNQAHLCR